MSDLVIGMSGVGKQYRFLSLDNQFGGMPGTCS
jgi:hypothetical protein